MSPVKEPHHFNSDGLMGVEERHEYESLFSEANDSHLAVGEASTHYFYSRVAVPKILEYDSGAKFIVCLRNPVEACQALHLERLYQGAEDIRDFEQAWHLQEARAQGASVPFNLRADPQRLQYGEYCRFGRQMERLYSLVPEERILVILLEDIRDDPSCVYSTILRFLGVPEEFDPEFKILNKAKRTRFIFLSVLIRLIGRIKKKYFKDIRMGLLIRLKSWNTEEAVNTGPNEETVRMLREYFQEDVLLLSSIIRRDLSGWLN